MGLLVKGVWKDKWYDTAKTGGKFVRSTSQFRSKIGEKNFKAEANRYHLYVSLACPWAHRTLIYLKLKKLEHVISYSVVDWLMGENGWETGDSGDPLYHTKYLYEIYKKADNEYSGRVTVPVLWDKKQETIVNNESSEIIRMLNTAFNEFGDASINLYPDDKAKEIDEVNEYVYDSINNGVYKAGFATTQEAYEDAVNSLFEALDKMEERLSKHAFIVGNSLTEADVRLFTTLIRFDAVYVGHFKCNIRRIADYQYLSAYVSRLYNEFGFKDTVNFEHIKNHYYQSHKTINPTGVVPKGPVLDYL